MTLNLPDLPAPTQGYVIYNHGTHKYSRGGTDGHWSKKPKIWSSIGALKNHLAMFISIEHRGKYPYYKKLFSVFERQPYDAQCEIYEIVSKTSQGTVLLLVSKKRTRHSGSEPKI